MKITKATVVNTGRAYKAHVAVLDEGLLYFGEAEGIDNPQAAVIAAAVSAVSQIKDKLIGSLHVKTEVAF